MAKEFKVSISDHKITFFPHSLVTIGLGSCVGIALYEPVSQTGGLSHIMLPDSKGFKDTHKWEKFADLAVPKMAEEIRRRTGRHNLLAKIAGGASMFQFESGKPGPQIGKRNIEAVKYLLKELQIPILAEHVGGKKGRTMFVDLERFEVKIRMVDREMFLL